MAGRKCPSCGHPTLIQTPTGTICTREECSFYSKTPPNEGKGGKGKKCVNCGKHRVFHNVCYKCGTYNNYNKAD